MCPLPAHSLASSPKEGGVRYVISGYYMMDDDKRLAHDG